MGKAIISYRTIIWISRSDGPSYISNSGSGVSKTWYIGYFLKDETTHRNDGPAMIRKDSEGWIYRHWQNRDKFVADEWFENLGLDPLDLSDEEVLMIALHLENQ